MKSKKWLKINKNDEIKNELMKEVDSELEHLNPRKRFQEKSVFITHTWKVKQNVVRIFAETFFD